jgi:ABC-type phosphate transport system substrate-binding protein
MTAIQSSRNLSAFNGSGVESGPAAATGLVTLTATDDYYFPIPIARDASPLSIHILTDAVIAGTFTLEACDFPVATDGTNIATVTDWNEVAGNWVQINTAVAGYAQGSGTGWTITVLSLVKTAGAGGAIVNLLDLGVARLRLKANITTSGTMRVMAHGKI